jgi:hypothetical protein
MPPKIVVEEVFDGEITDFDFPVYLRGFDPFTRQSFNGRFIYCDGSLTPVSYVTTRNEKLSNLFITYAVGFMRRYKEEYEQNNN